LPESDPVQTPPSVSSGTAGVATTTSDEPAPAAKTAQPSPCCDAPDESRHVAVVYFHGMGSQRHYEDVSRLVDRLDRVAYELCHARGTTYDGLRLVDRSAHVELPRDAEEANRGRDVVYLLARLWNEHEKRSQKTFRFYEAYWAPETVEGTNAAAVAVWLGQQVKKPLQLLFGAWRSYQRLRRGALVTLYHATRESPGQDAGRLRDRTARLIKLYEDFQRPGERSRYERGTFEEFELHIAKSLEQADKGPEATAALQNLARTWRRDHLRREWLHLGGILSVLAGAVGLVGLVALVSWRVLAVLAALLSGSFPESWQQLLDPTPGRVAMVATFLLSAFGVRGFLKDSVGDVQQYVTYEETNKLYQRRRAVLDSAMRQLRHVLENDECERVVIVAHSLGTAVAVDAMLGLWRYNVASGAQDPMKGPIPLIKIHHLVTYGSPIDKINYFFSVVHSTSATYERLVEDLRGDIGTPPFSKVGRQPHVHWINYWDKGDIVSGPIETVASEHMRGHEVDNVRIASFVLPDLARSHGAYLDHPQVLRDLLDVVVFGKHDYSELPKDATRKSEMEKSRRGPGAGSPLQSFCFASALVLPWLMLGLCFAIPFGRGGALWPPLAAVLAMHIAGYAAHRAGKTRRWLSEGLALLRQSVAEEKVAPATPEEDRPEPAATSTGPREFGRGPSAPVKSSHTLRSMRVVLRIVALIVTPAALAVGTVRHAWPPAYEPGTNPSPYGYTVSLLIFVLPCIVLAHWFATRRSSVGVHAPFLLALGWTTLVGFALDFFFANAFFRFPNAQATLGVRLPGLEPGVGWTWSIPIEEFVFYLSGFAAILLLYIWADDYWFRAYRAESLEVRARSTARLLGVHLGTLWITLGLSAAAAAFKSFAPHVSHAGFPGYLTYLLIVAATPSLALFGASRELINWRAFSLTMFLVLLVSLLWEVTLAIPYGWWAYRDGQMLGLFVEAWGHLPVEALLVWLASSWGAVVSYEAFRLLMCMRRPLRHALLGIPR
jgi:hypothetical protein